MAAGSQSPSALVVLGLIPKGTRFSLIDHAAGQGQPGIEPIGLLSRQWNQHLRSLRLGSILGEKHFTDSYGYVGGAMTASTVLGSQAAQENFSETQRSDGDPISRSIEAVTGYHIHASDGEIGHLKDFLVEDADWSILTCRRTKTGGPGRRS